MPSQIFRITRAPEVEPLDPQQVKSLLWHNRKDSEWEVTEMELEQAKLIPKCVMDCRRRHGIPNDKIRDIILSQMANVADEREQNNQRSSE